ncbi:hypothetical protein Bca4012_025677 [Brassica carinata]|uniref:Uncharacterized protein n=1 Tax=Brassica carinata TaxID=52824 RepID=A0A8X7VH13_BRACI|nr:hypothetical protein Bca52824_022782 [Brassica carinata]
MLTPLYTQNGIVLEELAPLTYSLESTNHVLDVGVRRFKATEIIHHYLAKYNDGDSFEGKLLSFLMDSPVSVVVCSYESFWRIVESDTTRTGMNSGNAKTRQVNGEAIEAL